MTPMKELIEFIKANNLLNVTTQQEVDGYLIKVEIAPLEDEEYE